VTGNLGGSKGNPGKLRKMQIKIKNQLTVVEIPSLTITESWQVPVNKT
jgi:hypothetical protein